MVACIGYVVVVTCSYPSKYTFIYDIVFPNKTEKSFRTFNMAHTILASWYYPPRAVYPHLRSCKQNNIASGACTLRSNTTSENQFYERPETEISQAIGGQMATAA